MVQAMVRAEVRHGREKLAGFQGRRQLLSARPPLPATTFDALGSRSRPTEPHGPMFADTLLRAQYEHLFRLLVWGGGSVLVGSAIFLGLAWRRSAPTMLGHFAGQMVAWGALELAFVAWAWQHLALLDVSGATRLDRMLWLNLGLDIGLIGVGSSLVVAGWWAERREGLLGTGVGVALQGAAMLLINGQLASVISR
jgi:Family of unknown function (DUF6992)